MMMSLFSILDVKEKSKIKANLGQNVGKYKFFTCSPNQSKYVDEYIYDCESLIIGTGGGVSFHYCNEPFSTSTDCLVFCSKDKTKLNIKWLYYYFCRHSSLLSSGFHGSGLKHVAKSYILNLKVDIPSIFDQEDTIKILDGICQTKMHLDSLLLKYDLLVKSQFVEMTIQFKDAPSTTLGRIAKSICGGTPSTKVQDYYGGTIPFVSTSSLGPDFIDQSSATTFITELAVDHSSTHLVTPYSLLVGIRIGVGKCSINTCEICTNQDIVAFYDYDIHKYEPIFLKKVIETNSQIYLSSARGATIKGVKSDVIKKTIIPNVPLPIQKNFSYLVAQVDKSKFRVKQLQEKLETLYKALLQKYFG